MNSDISKLVSRNSGKKESVLMGSADPVRTLEMVGVAGLEPAASWSRTMRDTKLRHTPKSYSKAFSL